MSCAFRSTPWHRTDRRASLGLVSSPMWVSRSPNPLPTTRLSPAYCDTLHGRAATARAIEPAAARIGDGRLSMRWAGAGSGVRDALAEALQGSSVIGLHSHRGTRIASPRSRRDPSFLGGRIHPRQRVHRRYPCATAFPLRDAPRGRCGGGWSRPEASPRSLRSPSPRLSPACCDMLHGRAATARVRPRLCIAVRPHGGRMSSTSCARINNGLGFDRQTV